MNMFGISDSRHYAYKPHTQTFHLKKKQKQQRNKEGLFECFSAAIYIFEEPMFEPYLHKITTRRYFFICQL